VKYLTTKEGFLFESKNNESRLVLDLNKDALFPFTDFGYNGGLLGVASNEEFVYISYTSKGPDFDIEGDAGWSSTKDLNKEKLPTCVSRGYLLSQAKGVTRIFTDYIKTKDKPTFDNIGNTTIIPTSVIISIKKLN
jgi:hypothetical protein